VELLKNGKIDVTPMVSHQLPLEDFVRGVEIIEKGLEDVLKVVILP
jgi:threonine dehydrogenase-like Zn-dependent dehydrogenase